MCYPRRSITLLRSKWSVAGVVAQTFLYQYSERVYVCTALATPPLVCCTPVRWSCARAPCSSPKVIARWWRCYNRYSLHSYKCCIGSIISVLIMIIMRRSYFVIASRTLHIILAIFPIFFTRFDLISVQLTKRSIA